MLLKGKNAIVTGCNRGIGKAIFEKFAENGANVFACARKKSNEFEELCGAMRERYKVEVFPIYFDAVDSDSMKKAIKEIGKVTKDIDILVNNMGVVQSVKLFQMMPMDEAKREFEVNFFAQMEFTQYISRYMIRGKKGSIINMSSCAGMDGNMGMFAYVSSKAAMIGATKRLAIELGEYGIRVNSVAPGLTDTDMGRQVSEELEQKNLQHLIIKRKANPEEIADAVVFFASDMSMFITGQTLRVDGGLLI